MICAPCRDRADVGVKYARQAGQPVARQGCGAPCGDPGCLCQHKGTTEPLADTATHGTLDLTTTTDKDPTP